MSERVTWEILNSSLLHEFPFLREHNFSKVIDGFEGWVPGPYVVFGSVFNPYILQTASDSPEAKARVAEFLERMVEAGAGHIDDLLEIEVLPTLLTEQKVVDAYWSHLGQKTRRLLRRLSVRNAPNIRIPETEENE